MQKSTEAFARVDNILIEGQYLRTTVERVIAMLGDDPQSGPVVSEMLRNALAFKAGDQLAVSA